MTYAELKNFRLSDENGNALESLWSKRHDISYSTTITFLISAVLHIALIVVSYSGWCFFTHAMLNLLNLPFFAMLCLVPLIGLSVGRFIYLSINCVYKAFLPYYTYNNICYIIYVNVMISVLANCVIYHHNVENIF